MLPPQRTIQSLQEGLRFSFLSQPSISFVMDWSHQHTMRVLSHSLHILTICLTTTVEHNGQPYFHLNTPFNAHRRASDFASSCAEWSIQCLATLLHNGMVTIIIVPRECWSYPVYTHTMSPSPSAMGHNGWPCSHYLNTGFISRQGGFRLGFIFLSQIDNKRL